YAAAPWRWPTGRCRPSRSPRAAARTPAGSPAPADPTGAVAAARRRGSDRWDGSAGAHPPTYAPSGPLDHAQRAQAALEVELQERGHQPAGLTAVPLVADVRHRPVTAEQGCQQGERLRGRGRRTRRAAGGAHGTA